ncbi:ultraviolet-B receptor UVR8 [Prosopis cineraria]|uniref:ultraviolet-B receptor UVR8 n=1 Tax=Prosopis cineraria TaxID=364024 RepID=UPI00240FE04F|nr:ultraviolet-B receptor UVR8 [Prosopis cineraria]
MEEDERKEKEKEKQRIWSWGAGTDGQLGTGSLQDHTLPQLLHLPSVASPISSLACGGAHVMALTSGGKVLTWGRGSSGQLGLGEVVSYALNPKPVTSLDDYFITRVSAGWSHSAFVSDSGCLFTCGDGSFGQLGHGDHTSHCSPVRVTCFVDHFIAQIACGMRHSIVLLKGSSTNQVYGFGSGKRGQLGISKDKIKSIGVPEVISELEDKEIVEVAANGDHSAAISFGGHLYMWGRGFKGVADAHSPQRINSSLRFAKAALGWNHALALTGEGEGFMLGGNHLGVLTDPQSLDSAKQLPVNIKEGNLEKVPGLNGVKIVDVAAGAEHSALVTENREIKTWGWGEHGQLGLGDSCDQTSPLTVSLGCELDEAESIRVFCGSGFTYALTMPYNTSLQ